MTPDHIETEILVQAPIEAVWKAVSQPEQLSSWFADTAEIDLQPGGDGVLSWDARATNQATSARISVMTVDPPHTFAFRWLHPAGEQATESNSMLVKFALATESDSTRVRLVDTALSKIEWPEEQKAKYADQSSHGWEIHLAHLKDNFRDSRHDRCQAPSNNGGGSPSKQHAVAVAVRRERHRPSTT